MHDNVNYNGPMELAFALPPCAPRTPYEGRGKAAVSAGPVGTGKANTKARQTCVIGKAGGGLGGM